MCNNTAELRNVAWRSAECAHTLRPLLAQVGDWREGFASRGLLAGSHLVRNR
eukprot:SAG11_NODE_38283_length_253_cov_0.649351_1_plen_51_part_10